MSSYFIDGRCGVNFSIFHKLLREYGWKESETNPYWLIFYRNNDTNKITKEFSEKKCSMKNMLENVKYIDNKYMVYDYFRNHFPEICKKYMPYSQDLAETKEYSTTTPLGKVWIVKPIGLSVDGTKTLACSGVDIFIVTNNEEFQKARSYILKTRQCEKSG